LIREKNMIYVMSDIHGNLPRFESVMKQIKLRPEDTLYILGDVIDRFPDGLKILKRIMGMNNVKMVLGNHEHMMLDALRSPYNEDDFEQRCYHNRMISIWYNNGGDVTHRRLRYYKYTVREEIFRFLESLPLSYDVNVNGIQYKLVHAAPEELYGDTDTKYRDSRQFAVWHRLHSSEPIPGNYTLIFGHTPTMRFQEDVILKIWHGNRRIGIDCGSGFHPPVKYGPPEYGRLACLRLDDMKEFYSERGPEGP